MTKKILVLSSLLSFGIANMALAAEPGLRIGLDLDVSASAARDDAQPRDACVLDAVDRLRPDVIVAPAGAARTTQVIGIAAPDRWRSRAPAPAARRADRWHRGRNTPARTLAAFT